MIELDRETIADFVAEALAEIPAELARAMSNVQVVVSDRNVDEPELLGLYEGVPLTERGDTYAGMLPDRITIYTEPLLDMCTTVFEVAEEVRITVLHEVGHHFGIDDDDLDELGWG